MECVESNYIKHYICEQYHHGIWHSYNLKNRPNQPKQWFEFKIIE